MKKHLLLTILGLVLADQIWAQVQVGVRAGVHWGTLTGKNTIADRSLEPGFAVAIPVQARLTECWSLRAEPSVIQKGWHSNVDYTTALGTPAGTGKLTQRYEVAEVPLLVSFRGNVNKHVAYYALAGPSVGYVLGGRLRIFDRENEILEDQLRFQRRIETGIWAGGGLEIPIGRVPAFLDVRYQFVLSQYPTYQASAPRQSAQGFTVSVGCWLPTKK